MLSLDRGSVAIGGVRLMDDVSLRLAPGVITGLIGPNGAGKSTLVRVLARQQQLTSGECRLEGEPYESFDSRRFSRCVAYLPQSIPATHGLAVDELVCMGRFPWHGALGKFTPKDRAAVDEALALTGTGHFANRMMDTLSGGEQQRCWIAMLLAQEAGVLLLDEPVSALDIRHQIETMEIVHDIARRRDVSVLVILHDINLATGYCDEVVALKCGRIAWRGPSRSLMDADVLESIYETPMTVIATPEQDREFAMARLPR
ncbi:MAG: ABC transporter ATP-binding protein [Gammaproteobacteria bacterium PRO9]|nr:ABC transporter ATP-binding protein [Gammaproteobacteria bacterium PRO9]